MRETYIIEREIDSARLDLETRIGALREAIAYKLDIKRRLREAFARRVERGRERARILALQGKELAFRGMDAALAHKALLAGILAGAAVFTLLWWRVKAR